MPKTLTEDAESANLAIGLPYPVNGDTGTDWWATQESAIQQLADRTQALGQLAVGGVATGKVLQVSLSVYNNFDSRFTQYRTPLVHWFQTSVTDAGALYFPLCIPPGVRLTAITAQIQGTYGTAHSNLPVTLPTLSLAEQDSTSISNVASVTDAPANVAAYDAVHNLTLTYTQTISASRTYYAILTGETGTNSIASRFGLNAMWVTLRSAIP